MISLLEIDNSRKHELPIHCPHCATNRTIRYGGYQRAHPELPALQRIPHFRGKSPTCPWKTLSVLLHPFLPIVRHFPETNPALPVGHQIVKTKRKTVWRYGIISRLLHPNEEDSTLANELIRLASRPSRKPDGEAVTLSTRETLRKWLYPWRHGDLPALQDSPRIAR